MNSGKKGKQIPDQLINRLLLVYAEHITPRLKYIANILFQQEISYTDSDDFFLEYRSAKINYSVKPFTGAFTIIPYGLLEEKNISIKHPDIGEWKELVMFYKTAGDIPFDIFSASFYLLARYEEYLPYQADEYGRYPYTDSLAYKEGFLHLPLINLWVRELELVLLKRFAGLFQMREQAFTFLPTYDIDIAYSYRYQSLARNIFGFYRDLLQGNYNKVAERAKVYSGRIGDPFDVYGWLDILHEKYQLQPRYFFLMAEKRGKYDKNIQPRKKGMRQLIIQHAAKYQVGIHPSFNTDNADKLYREKKLLEQISKSRVIHSRQHYLRMQLPGTYRNLIAAGIQHDHSMGYGAINGFRASYTVPYKWYDLENESEQPITIHPFCYMDAAAVFGQRYTPEQALLQLEEYQQVVQKVKGRLVVIFHNHFLTEQPEWEVWRNMYEKFLLHRISI